MANISEKHEDIHNQTSTFCTTIPPALREKKFGELWSTIHEDLVVKSYPPKSAFSENHILVPKRCCTPKIFTLAPE